MTDASWDNGGGPPAKKGMGTGMKVLAGCGVAVLGLGLTCVVGGVLLKKKIEKDPQAFEEGVLGWAKGKMQKDWDRLRAVVEQLGTDAGARALYQANGRLHEDYATEDAFLAAVRGWRPKLGPLPAEVPLKSHHRRHGQAGPDPAPKTVDDFNVDISKTFGSTRIRCRFPEGGARLSVTFDGERLTHIQVD